MTRVSVLLPVHNAEAYLAEAVESVLAQSWTEFELIAIDDGSTDGSRTILEAFAARDGRVRVVSRPNRGLIATLNEGIGLARGDLIARMDADDICLPDRFARQVDYLDRNPDCVLVGGSSIIMDAEGRPIFREKVAIDHREIDGRNLRGLVAIRHPTVMLRKEPVVRGGGYRSDFDAAEDLDLWLRLAEIGRIANLPDLALRYRVHWGSVSGRQREQQRTNALRACEAAWARRGIRGSFESRDRRLEDTHTSRREWYLRYGWQAWTSGYRATWRHYAWQSVRIAPLSRDAWKLLVIGALRDGRKQPS